MCGRGCGRKRLCRNASLALAAGEPLRASPSGTGGSRLASTAIVVATGASSLHERAARALAVLQAVGAAQPRSAAHSGMGDGAPWQGVYRQINKRALRFAKKESMRVARERAKQEAANHEADKRMSKQSGFRHSFWIISLPAHTYFAYGTLISPTASGE